MALRIARDYWRHRGLDRPRVLSFARGYHGSTLLAKSLTALPGNTADVEVAVPVTHIATGKGGMELRTGSAAPLLDKFERELESGDVGAVVVEPLLNVGGGIVLPDNFLAGLSEQCRHYGALLICDEVFTGLGRTGVWLAHRDDGATADIFTLSKGLSMGCASIASVSVRASIRDSYANSTSEGALKYGHTNSGHAVACALALEGLQIVRDEGLLDNCRTQGTVLLEALEALRLRPGVVDVRGRGLVVTVEMHNEAAASAVVNAALARGVILRQQAQHVMAVPPLIINDAEIAELADTTLDVVLNAASGR